MLSHGGWQWLVWCAVVALDFFYLSSPLVFEPSFDDSLRIALAGTSLACLLTIPWLRMPRVPWVVLPFLGFGLATAAWSVNSSDTVSFVGLYVVLTLLGVVVATNVSTRVLSVGVMTGAAVVVFASVYAYWRGLPGADVLPGSSGFLAGVGTNRNILAYTMILAFPFAVSFVPRGRLLRAAWAAGILVILAGIVLAGSATGIIAVSVTTAVAVVMGSRDWLVAAGRAPGRRFWGTLAVAVLLVGVLGIGGYEALGRDLHRDLSLTGRVRIWEAVWASAGSGTIVVGEGWGAVWPHPWRPASANGQFDAIVQELGHYVPHAHNSVMDLLPEVGMVGIALFALVYAVPVVQALVRRRRSPGTAGEATRFAVLGVLALVLAGTTEPVAMVPLGYFVAVLIVAHRPSAAPGTAPGAARPEAVRAGGARRAGRPGPTP